jgi:hypothetical protein
MMEQCGYVAVAQVLYRDSKLPQFFPVLYAMSPLQHEFTNVGVQFQVQQGSRTIGGEMAELRDIRAPVGDQNLPEHPQAIPSQLE